MPKKWKEKQKKQNAEPTNTNIKGRKGKQQQGEQLTKELNSFRGDTAFFTQPIISGHAGSQAFARRRERIYNRYHKGMEEYRKKRILQDRAETARQTASMSQLKENPGLYLANRIKNRTARLKSYNQTL